MSAISDRHSDNILLGSGHLFIDVLGAAGARTGERYLGDAAGATLAVESERVQVFSGSGPVARQLVNKVRSLTRRLSATLHDVSMENLALFVGAGDAVGSETDAAARVGDAAAEALTVRRGRWYQLGVSAARPAGVRAVRDATAAGKDAGHFDAGATAAIVTTAAAAPSAANTVSRSYYAVDAANGRIYIRESGGATEAGKAAAALPANGGTVYVHYTPVAEAARAQVATPATPQDVRAAVRYIEETATGRGRNLYAPLCSVAASGELALMSRETEQQIQIAAEILEPGGGKAALLIDEQAS